MISFLSPGTRRPKTPEIPDEKLGSLSLSELEQEVPRLLGDPPRVGTPPDLVRTTPVKSREGSLPDAHVSGLVEMSAPASPGRTPIRRSHAILLPAASARVSAEGT